MSFKSCKRNGRLDFQPCVSPRSSPHVNPDSQNGWKSSLKKWSSEPVRVHGVIYRKAFGESLNDVKAVGEGFGIIDDEFKITSGALNPARGDDYHDDSPLMNEDSARFFGALVKIWKDTGPNFPARQNYTEKELAD